MGCWREEAVVNASLRVGVPIEPCACNRGGLGEGKERVYLCHPFPRSRVPSLLMPACPYVWVRKVEGKVEKGPWSKEGEKWCTHQ